MSEPHQQNTPLRIKATIVYSDDRRVTGSWMVTSGDEGKFSFEVFSRRKDALNDELFRVYFTLADTKREDPGSSEYLVMNREITQDEFVWEPLQHAPGEPFL